MKKYALAVALSFLITTNALAATITITVPNGVLSRVLDAFAATYNWNSSMGVTKAEFARIKLIEHIKTVVSDYEVNQSVSAITSSYVTVDLGAQ
jgi:hypothetical protein